MIVFIEPLGKPYNHLAVVKPLLFTFLRNVKSEEIVFVSSLEYFESIPINFRKEVYHKNIKLSESTLYNIFNIVLVVLKIMFEYRKSSSLKVFLLMSKSYSNFILKVLSFILLFKNKLYVFIHGELQNIDLKGSFFMNLDGIIHKMVFFLDTKFKSNLKFIIISNYVFNNFEKVLGYKPTNVIGFDLPYYYDDNITSNKSIDTKIIVATVGVNSVKKRSHLFNEIAIHFKDKIKLNLIEFCTTGRSDGVIFNEFVSNPITDNYSLLSSEEYSALISKTDILVFFNDESYNLITSASYFDAINFKKPILAIKNDQWQYNFKVHGEIGFLCANTSEMIEIINQILLDKSILNKFSSNLELAYSKTSILNQHDKLLSKLNF